MNVLFIIVMSTCQLLPNEPKNQDSPNYNTTSITHNCVCHPDSSALTFAGRRGRGCTVCPSSPRPGWARSAWPGHWRRWASPGSSPRSGGTPPPRWTAWVGWGGGEGGGPQTVVIHEAMGMLNQFERYFLLKNTLYVFSSFLINKCN